MGQRSKSGATRESAAEQEMRDQEVLRANRELAAYFKGRRTDREARAALKIIKAFVRDRERRDGRSRPALPGAPVGNVANANVGTEVTNRKVASDGGRGERRRQQPRRKNQDPMSKSVRAAIGPHVNAELPQSSKSDERTPE